MAFGSILVWLCHGAVRAGFDAVGLKTTLKSSLITVCASLGIVLLMGGIATVGAAPKPPLTPEPTPQTAPLGPQVIDGAILQGLDKTTARVSRFEAPLGKPVKFGTLSITVRDCRKRPPEESPESAAFIAISDRRPGQLDETAVFGAWMFASSPSVSALDHPVYDVVLLDCRVAGTASQTAPKPTEK